MKCIFKYEQIIVDTLFTIFDNTVPIDVHRDTLSRVYFIFISRNCLDKYREEIYSLINHPLDDELINASLLKVMVEKICSYLIEILKYNLSQETVKMEFRFQYFHSDSLPIMTYHYCINFKY